MEAPVKPVALIACGGALGTWARYQLTLLLPVRPGTFPWATFWANTTGSLLLGLVFIVLIDRFPPRRFLRAFAATGFVGAYTTFSTFVVDADTLIKDGHVVLGATYVIVSSLVGFVAVWAGISAGRRLRIGPQ